MKKESAITYRTTEIQSALGLAQLKKLDRNNKKREEMVEIYREGLKENNDISIPFSKFKGNPSYHLFPILVAPRINRNKVMQGLKDFGIGMNVSLSSGTSLFSLSKTIWFQRGNVSQD